jgi:hypothetical protein
VVRETLPALASMEVTALAAVAVQEAMLRLPAVCVSWARFPATEAEIFALKAPARLREPPERMEREEAVTDQPAAWRLKPEAVEM